MNSRRDFLKHSAALAFSSALIPSITSAANAMLANKKVSAVGVQLYSFRKEMAADPAGTLKKIAALGFKEIESARSDKGNYYGLSPKEIKKICGDLGLIIRSGHIHVDDKFQQSLDAAVEAGQEYLVCSSLPTSGQTVDNYKKVADVFMKAGEDCKKKNVKFGYHNHAHEFESENGQTLYDVLLDNTDPKLVHMELDLGWVVVGGKDPLDYFKRYPGRFPLWHLKDMNLQKKESTEFGKGGLNIVQMLKSSDKAGVKHIFIEQEEFASSAFESMKYDIDYLKKLDY